MPDLILPAQVNCTIVAKKKIKRMQEYLRCFNKFDFRDLASYFQEKTENSDLTEVIKSILNSQIMQHIMLFSFSSGGWVPNL